MFVYLTFCPYRSGRPFIAPGNIPGLQDVKENGSFYPGLHHKTFYVSSLHQIFNDYQFQPMCTSIRLWWYHLELVAKGLE
jgi:hypothetical protein